MALPEIVDRATWTAARVELLEREKRMTRERDALNADRRRLPMVDITAADYRFTGPDGPVGLLELFGGRRQLIVGHMMFEPDAAAPCSGCSAGANEISTGLLAHLAHRDTSFAAVSVAPFEKLEAARLERGWPFAWYSSAGSTFNADHGVTVGPEASPIYNYRPYLPDDGRACEQPGTSVFLRDGARIFHTYSTYARGAEMLGGAYYWLDLTPLGRGEDWEEPKDRHDCARPAEPHFDN